MRKFTATIFFFGLSSLIAFAQNENAKKEEKNSDNKTATFVEFSNAGKKPEASAKQVLKDYFKTTGNHDFQEMKKENDAMGFSHARHQQYFRGIKVENGMYVTHARGGMIETMSGDFVPIDDNFNIKPSLSEQNALASAVSSVGATEYMWETEDAADYYAKVKGKYAPQGELVIVENFKASNNASKIIPHLAYKFDIYSTQPLSRASIYVDAASGEILLVNPIIHHVAATGTLATRFSGSLPAKTDLSSGKYRLRDYTRGLGIETFNLRKGTSYTRAIDFTDVDNNWTAAEFNNINKDNAAFDVHLGLQNTYDYFKNVLGRNSYDNNNSKMKAYVHYSTNYVNAFWDGSRMTYGDGNGTTFDPLTSQDVTSHELGHGVCQFTANLVYSNQSGALNEAFSDIWGACVEFAYFPNKKTWYVGDDFDLAANKGFRNMANPNEFGHPDTYLGTYWYTGTADNGGVHKNSGVLNYCFYLLTTGGSGTNDIGSVFNVAGLGITDAAKIFYRAESVYMTSSTNYAGARTACIQAAKDLYGVGSAQEISTTNAFYAVGVGAAYPVAVVTSLAPPTDLQNTAVTENTFTSSWKPVDGATEYEVQILTGDSWSKMAISKTNKVEIISSLPVNEAIWRVIAKSKNGEEAISSSLQLPKTDLTNEDIISYQVYPNPSTDLLKLQYKAQNAGDVDVQIIDIMGRVFTQKSQRVDVGNNEMQLNIQTLPRGRYLLKVNNVSSSQESKVSVKTLLLE